MDEFIAQEISSMELVYNEIVHNMCLLLEKIGLASDVTGINVIVKYMINNGYLTNNEVLNRSDYLTTPNKISQFFRLDKAGLLIPYGCSVCRHVANYLFEIYNSLGYASSQLFVYSPHVNIKYSFLDGVTCTSQQVQSIMDSLLLPSMLESEEDFRNVITRDGITFDINYTGSSKDIINTGNHTINIVLDKNGKSHLIDSQKNQAGLKTEDGRFIKMFQDRVFSFKWFIRDYCNKSFLNTRGKFDNAFFLLDRFSTIPIQEEFSNIEHFEGECQKLIAEFEQFKAQNGRYYDSISGSVLKLVRSLDK